MNNSLPVILCVGSDKIMGDSVGPSVGDLLTKTLNIKCFVYGVTGRSVNGKNLNSFVDFIKIVHKDSPIIAVDACLSNTEEIENIRVLKGGVNPKRALTNLPNPVGDIGILGVVDKIKPNPLSALLTVSSVNVQKICAKIAFVLSSAIY
ncbi:MAG: DUF1256 domain-containing protein [Clostridia bacterium]